MAVWRLFRGDFRPGVIKEWLFRLKISGRPSSWIVGPLEDEGDGGGLPDGGASRVASMILHLESFKKRHSTPLKRL